MVKILVADDNSNIQKMVGLALKDQGIDVVAVGNGEAAVRKIADVRPDLVLADVFMPVRNGYEVCQYVKMDAALAHIPVILLVGAFDPLDEQEAQRVGADGVLKKPFVPPDPLISMVKSALARAGVTQGGSSGEKTPEPAPVKAADFLEVRTTPVPTLGSIPVATTPPLDTESFVDEVPAGPEPVKIDMASQPVAFGSLLETPAEEAEENLGFLPPAHPELATERKWHDPDAEEGEEEEEIPAAEWKRAEADEEFAGAPSSGGVQDWRAGGFEQIQLRKTQVEDWEEKEEKTEAAEAAKAEQAESAIVGKAPESAPVAKASPFAADAWAGVTASASEEKTAADTVKDLEEVVHSESRAPEIAAAPVSDASAATAPEPEEKANADSWFSISQNPWNAEIQKANRLVSTWDSAMPTAAPPATSNGTAETAAATIQTPKAAIEEAALPTATAEAVQEDAAQAFEEATPAAAEHSEGEASSYAHEEEAKEAPQTAAPSMDEVVAKVLAKMSPEVLQAVTREILKPVVEAMVKEEMNAKKS